ncbi:MAG TPA: hypothetical protein VH111_04620 [Steroidobacteraceae bacterium]|nr:hypothetical protein [Steroidobacteraceae bacterium]
MNGALARLARTARLARRGVLLAWLLLASAHAEPYLALGQGAKCSQCHVNPTGGGLRNAFGDVFAQTQMPAGRFDTGADVWAGQITRFLAAGGDLRFDASAQQLAHTPTANGFQMQQTRIYLAASVIPDRLLVYADEQVAPGGALNREAWGLFWSADHTWYLKGGQMYLPFGLRLQDQSAFVKQATGINMTTPDQGVEVGWLKGHWDTQLAVSNGTAGGAATTSGKQASAQVAFVDAAWRLGAALNSNDAAASGSRRAAGLFGGLKTGPVVWLGEADLVDDRSLGNGGVRMLATLIEGDWALARGHNLKITGEYFDPNRRVSHDQRTRWSLLYELTPVQFVQLRAGVRYSDGIPQLASEHARLYFLELHGFF